jgi:hypothetical protein
MQLPPQRLLFCSTQPGKQSIVRQIEPDLHIDADIATVSSAFCLLRVRV